jgi:1,2-diacylglycerol 3-alpha-glucosyltransferase
MPSVAILFHRLGPYHYARCAAAGSRCRLTVIELTAVDDTYAWSRVDGAPNFTRLTLFADEDVDRKPKIELTRQLHRALAAADPDVVAIPGWSHAGALAALLWCLRKGRPAVLMSDSGMHDDVRRRTREAAKRRLVRLFRSAIVAGAPQREYACALGLSPGTVFDGYDAVDNEHFERGARQARLAEEPGRQRLGLPRRFFLASSRFVAKKNLLGLLDAYATYRRETGAEAWRLVLLGDGELRAQIESRIARLDLAGDVVLPGFQQYEALPVYYGLASAFVHASTAEQWGLVVNEAMAAGLPVIVSQRCGCVPDLVRDGINGFTFDPGDVRELADHMARVASEQCDRATMGAASRRIIADWGLQRFAHGLMSAVDVALSRQPPRAGWADRLLLSALISRRAAPHRQFPPPPGTLTNIGTLA